MDGKVVTSKSDILSAKDFISCISFNLFVTAAMSVTCAQGFRVGIRERKKDSVRQYAECFTSPQSRLSASIESSNLFFSAFSERYRA